MKKSFLIIFSFFISISSFSQKDSIVNYLDKSYHKIAKERATYIQTIVKKDTLWLATVYFGNGKMKLQGHFKNKNLKTKTGLFKTFNDKGNLKTTQVYNSEGKKDGTYNYYSNNGKVMTVGTFQNGKEVGEWIYLDENLTRRAQIIFKDGKVLNHNLWDDQGSEIKEELVLLKVPEYNEGSRKLRIKLKNELIRDLRKKGLKTNFLLKCEIGKEGNVQNISITPKLDSKYEEQIINYFANLKGIEPGIIANMKVDYPWEIPFIIN
ncbi:hypothetical protein LPB03_00825 [Polaribacter vadi]|uniref:TonB C-terminal domain-containing protein n=1 Tax=Polaribacter vadi TaxID=1774273 RepID=A0A1B8U136_9FLAO|nr:hypothetical protein [Polaribacter vadi]AOW16089.1 hypothetical protein LPB03_00825 [Polaribacter vadi]OBY65585.1 hypothetical protein LPB3_04285 [Polaribacter vadi]